MRATVRYQYISNISNDVVSNLLFRKVFEILRMFFAKSWIFSGKIGIKITY